MWNLPDLSSNFLYFSLFISIYLSFCSISWEISSTLSSNPSTGFLISVTVFSKNSFLLFAEITFFSNLFLFHGYNFFSFLSEDIRIVLFACSDFYHFSLFGLNFHSGYLFILVCVFHTGDFLQIFGNPCLVEVWLGDSKADWKGKALEQGLLMSKACWWTSCWADQIPCIRCFQFLVWRGKAWLSAFWNHWQ